MLDKGMFFYGADGYLRKLTSIVETFEESGIASGLSMLSQAQDAASTPSSQDTSQQQQNPTPANANTQTAAPAPNQSTNPQTTGAVANPNADNTNTSSQETSTDTQDDEEPVQELSEPQRTYNMYETYRPLFRKYTVATYTSTMTTDTTFVNRAVQQAKLMIPMQTNVLKSATTLAETARAIKQTIEQAMSENNGQIQSLNRLQKSNEQKQEDINYWQGLIKDHEQTLQYWVDVVNTRESQQRGIGAVRGDMELARRYIKDMEEVLSRAHQYIRELKASMQSDANAAKDISDMIAQGQSSFNEIRENGRKQIGEQIAAIRNLITQIRPPILELTSTYTTVLARLLKYKEFFDYMEQTISQPIAKKSKWILELEKYLMTTIPRTTSRTTTSYGGGIARGGLGVGVYTPYELDIALYITHLNYGPLKIKNKEVTDLALSIKPTIDELKYNDSIIDGSVVEAERILSTL